MCPSSACTSVPVECPRAGCTTRPAGFESTIRCASSNRMSSGMSSASSVDVLGGAGKTSIRSPARVMWRFCGDLAVHAHVAALEQPLRRGAARQLLKLAEEDVEAHPGLFAAHVVGDALTHRHCASAEVVPRPVRLLRRGYHRSSDARTLAVLGTEEQPPHQERHAHVQRDVRDVEDREPAQVQEVGDAARHRAVDRGCRSAPAAIIASAVRASRLSGLTRTAVQPMPARTAIATRDQEPLLPAEHAEGGTGVVHVRQPQYARDDRDATRRSRRRLARAPW